MKIIYNANDLNDQKSISMKFFSGYSLGCRKGSHLSKEILFLRKKQI